MKRKKIGKLKAEPVLQWPCASWLCWCSRSCNLLLCLKVIKEVSQCDLLCVFHSVLCSSKKQSKLTMWLCSGVEEFYIYIKKSIHQIRTISYWGSAELALTHVQTWSSGSTEGRRKTQEHRGKRIINTADGESLSFSNEQPTVTRPQFFLGFFCSLVTVVLVPLSLGAIT